ncbi:hypothetical protein GH714_019429 [Hevea brasiliensis]|uniref:Uncharacterized protein n=1 Tax=Hevea brasiliensis TaxID=3981 RepID=A0A6A6MF57_HEVBR|nr:hypothetical protein GH714_019429 [Hevea brasiliensis]
MASEATTEATAKVLALGRAFWWSYIIKTDLTAINIRMAMVLSFFFVGMGHIEKDLTNATYCVYNSDVATGYGVGAFLFLLSSESLLMGVTKCMCFGRPLAQAEIELGPSSILSHREACLIAGAVKNAYHTKYRGMIYAQNFSCETLRKGVFVAGAVFVVATMVLNVYYYMYFSKATAPQAAQKANRTSSNVGMAGYA